MTSPPPEIWRVVFEYLAALSRAYLIPLRCVCKAWSDLAKVAKVRFRDPMTRLLTVSARDNLPNLCTWAHDQGGLVGRAALLASARSCDVGLVSLVCGWSNGAWGWTERDQGISSNLEYDTPNDPPKIVSDEMLRVATENEAGESCRYLVETCGALDVIGMVRAAAKVDSILMLQLAEELFPEEDIGIGCTTHGLILTLGQYGSSKLLEHVRDREPDEGMFWNLVFLGAAKGGRIDTYELAKTHISALQTVVVSEKLLCGFTSGLLLNQSLRYAIANGHIEICRALLRDGAAISILCFAVRGDRNPELGRVAIDAGATDIHKSAIEDWEREKLRAKRRRVSAFGEDDYLSDG